MDKYLCRKDVYDEIEKAMRDRSHLTEKVITDKNGHQRKVWVRGGEEPSQQKTKKTEEPDENKTAKPKHSTGDTVTLDGAKGDFKVSSIDKDGTYHVVSADGKKGYKVSENHITGNKGQNKAQKMADAEDKAFEEGQKNAQKKYGDMSIEELEKFIDEKSKAGKYTPEYKEAMDANDVLQQKKKDREEINFEKKNNASKSEEVARKNDAENNVNDAIKLTDAEKKEITDTFTPELQEDIKKYGRNDSTVIGNIILNNLSSTGKKDLFNKIRKQEWDYKDANDKHGNTFNSDYAKEAMYQLYQEYQKNGKESQKEDYSDWGDMSTEKKKTPEKASDGQTEGVKDTKTVMRNLAKNDPVAYMAFMDRAKKDYEQYKKLKDMAEVVDRAPAFASFPGYATAKKDMESLEKKYPGIKEKGLKDYMV